MKVHPSALKHRIEGNDTVWAAQHPVYLSDLDEDSPARQFRLGFDNCWNASFFGSTAATSWSSTP